MSQAWKCPVVMCLIHGHHRYMYNRLILCFNSQQNCKGLVGKMYDTQGLTCACVVAVKLST